jgi:hypothetical protein
VNCVDIVVHALVDSFRPVRHKHLAL